MKIKNSKLIEKNGLYYPSKEFQKKALINNKAIYKKAEKNPLKFWEGLAKELKWQKKWKKVFEHNPPYFKWFLGGKINITENALDRHLEKNSNKLAFIWEPEPTGEKQRIFTYEELFKEVNKFANALKKIGVKKGDRVGIYLPMIPEAIISMLACARIGAVHCVIFSAFSPQALKVRLQDTGAKVLITADGYYRRGKIINLKQSADEGIKETEVEKMVIVKRANNEILLEKNKNFWWHDLIKDEKDLCEPEVMDSEDLLFILYTSGSTGKPKGCCHICGGYAVQANFTTKWIFDLKDDDIFWSTADLGWITGHTYSCYGPLLSGATFVIFEGSPDWPNPDRWCDIIEKYGVTTFYTAPTAIRMFEKYGTELVRKHKLETLQILGSVGEPIDEAAWLWYFNEVGRGKCPLVDTWWQTETGGILISSLPGVGPFKPTFTGLPFPGIKFDILDEKGKSLPSGKEGNLVIRPPFAPGILRDIYKNPQKYLETYWNQYEKKVYLTSDGAFRDKNGLIRIIGRVDDVIKVAGHRITTGEIESAAALHLDITESAAIGLPDEIKGESPVIFIVSKTDKSKEELKKEVIELIRKQIGPIATPKEVYLVKDLPRTRSGKIMRRILKKLFTNEDLGDLSTLSNPECVEEIKKIIAQH
ncbi:MAG: acetate--CoA ligase [bacterium]|nr:acetate--CoA ligase [bacterium]